MEEQAKQQIPQEQQLQSEQNQGQLVLDKQKLQLDLFEQKVGITEFVNKGEQVLGIVKYRFTDFIVNEIDRKTKKTLFYNEINTNQIYGLQNFHIQKKQQQEIQIQENIQEEKQQEKDDQQQLEGETEQQKEEENKRIERKIQEVDVESCKKFIGEQNTEDLEKFYEDWRSGEKKTFYEILIQAPEEKQSRQAIHEFVREKLPYFDSQTKDDKILIKFTKNVSKRQKFKSKDKVKKPELTFQFTLFKSNMDTNVVIGNLAQFLRTNQKFFGTAGLKDKRGITTQKMTIKSQRQTLEDFSKNMKNYKSPNLFMGDYEVVKHPLNPGDLYGNRFSIGFRLIDINPNKEAIIQNIEKLQNDGFINYFGMQRFGSGDIKSHQIGLYLLKKEYKQAADLILYGNGLQYQKILDNYKKTFDANEALAKLPKFLKRERDMIQFYKKNGTNSHFECLCSLPKNVIDIYPHAYQSYIWNKLASLRMQKFGNKLAIGDLVIKKSQIKQEGQQEQLDQPQEGEENEFIGINQIQYDYIDENNINDYSLKDVLIPIIGPQLNLDFQKYNLGQDLLNMLENDGISLDLLAIQNLNYFLSGGYRKLIFVVEELEYKFINYNSLDQDFITPFQHKEEDFNDPNGKYSAIILRFTLQKGCYATMLIREFTKLGSSLDTQLHLTDYYKQQL